MYKSYAIENDLQNENKMKKNDLEYIIPKEGRILRTSPLSLPIYWRNQ